MALKLQFNLQSFVFMSHRNCNLSVTTKTQFLPFKVTGAKGQSSKTIQSSNFGDVCQSTKIARLLVI